MKNKFPTAFVSYSWDNIPHKEWVRELSARLRSDGVNVTLDQWHSIPGDQLPKFMEKSIRENDYVLIICTKKYKEKSDEREGGVGYEGDIITAELFAKGNNRKFIPILRGKDWRYCSPSWLSGKYYVSLNNDPYLEDQYQDLLATILDTREKAPLIGEPITQRKAKASLEDNIKSGKQTYTYDQIQIVGVLADEVTTPRMDGSRGSALYTIPIKLSKKPSSQWIDVFIQLWNHPPKYSPMHRPGIASVSKDRIILKGTTIEEVRDYHRDTLILCVEKANEISMDLIIKKRKMEDAIKKQEDDHQNNVNEISNEIEF